MQDRLHATAAPKTRRRRLIALALALATIPLLGEGMTRWLAPQWLVRSFYAPDADFGYRIRPGRRELERSDHYRYNVVTNEDGLRMDASVRRSDGTMRILALGDSFTFGWGVEFEDSFISRIEQSLAAAEPAVQLLNAGVGGYSTGHVYKSLALRAGRLAPCAAIYFLNPNDIADNLITDPAYRVTSYRQLDDGSFLLSDESVYSPARRRIVTSRPYGWLNRNSHLFHLAKRVGGRTRSVESSTARGPMSEAEADRAIRLTEAHIARLISLAHSLELPLLVVGIPDWSEIFPPQSADGVYPELKRRLGLALNDAFVDPATALRREIANEGIGVTQFYFADGEPVGHFTAEGHALFARSAKAAIEDFVARACDSPNERQH